ncbi:MAG: thioredoxin domain-containing protein [Ferruginibacter sp.]
MEHAFTNELIHETSPYLLQHAHNPVQWHAWGEPALAKAKEMDKPILVSIGYAACHWCHVMEKESFENEEVAAYMNEHFINIKIDREERPDLDHIYMDAVQAIAGNGGWPLNVFLTTEAKPFYGGTYFPPQKAFNRPSWKEVLFYINDAWKKRRDEIEKQAEELLEHINSSNHFIGKNQIAASLNDENNFTIKQCRLISENILKSADTIYGGFGNAPKFPQTFTIQYLLSYGHYFQDQKALDHATFSLTKMLEGGIYDHLAGGLARYSTDEAWLAPHFEKMLYDNALLVSVLCDAFQITGNGSYKNAIEKTLAFFINEMQHPDGGFYAALDADSEGVEGKFYVWDKAEIDHILGDDSKIFCKWYGVTEHGNWEHKNILHITVSKEHFATEHKINTAQLENILVSSENKLLSVRNKRIRPATDDKILLGWNALLLNAFCKASAALGNDDYKRRAISLFDFLNEKFSQDGNIVYHSYKNNIAKHPAYLDDYSCLIQSCILLQQSIPGQEYLVHAKKITNYVIEHFQDQENGFFCYTHKDQNDIIARKIEIYDSALPSGNSTMAENLFYLAIVFDKREWWAIANKMLKTLSEIIFKYPSSFGIWANLIFKQVAGIDEIIITGKNTSKELKEVLGMYLPNKVLHSADVETDLPLLKNKIYGNKAMIYLCKNYSCSPPVEDVEQLKQLLKFNRNNA